MIVWDPDVVNQNIYNKNVFLHQYVQKKKI